MVVRLTCLASAMVALSAGTTAAAQTPAAPPPNPTTTSPESDQVLLKADVITDDTKNLITTAEGNVEVRVGQRVMRADRLIYDQNKQTMRAQGNVQVIDENGGIQFADEIEADEEFRNGFATRFSARLGGNAIATASSAIRTDGTRNALEQVVYTGCPICEATGDEPTWSLRARRAVQNTETQMISYQDAVLEIKGVPVLYLPYFAHPDPTSQRRSGLLAPDAGVSSKLGPFYEQPYYWAISPSQDMTIAPMISTNVNPLVKVDYRKRFFSGFIALESSATYEQEFNSDGDKFGDKTWRSHLYGGGRFKINEDWQWGFGIERQTDDLYDLRYDIDGEDDLRGLFASQPRQLLSQAFTTGQTENFYLEGGAFVFQGLRAGDDDAKFPRVAPSIFAQKVFDFGKAGQIAADLSAVGLFRDEAQALPDSRLPGGNRLALDTARATASADWGSQYIVGPGLVVEPFAMGRGDFYRVDDGSGAENISRFLGVGGAQVSYPFIRRGEAVDIIIEPVVMVAYGTEDANDPRIPNEDALVFEADESTLFKPNSVSNYDLWEGGGRAAAGVSATAQVGKDIEVSTLFGKRWRAADDPAFNQLSNLKGTESDYVASVKAEVGSALRVGARFRLDQDLAVNRLDLDASANWWRLSGGARYFRVDKTPLNTPTPTAPSVPDDEGLLWNGKFKISDRWSTVIAQQRNIALKEDIGLSIGLAYQDECSYFLLSFERSGGRDRTLGPSESIRFSFVLTGLGGVSDSNFD